MLVSAKLRNLHIAPRKVRMVADMIRGKKAEQASSILNFTIKGASLPLFKLLKQAMANAKNNFQMDPANLFVFKIAVDEGPKQKRWMPRARGQAYEIQKKTSHVTLVLEEIIKTKGKIRKTKEGSVEKEEEEEEKIFKAEKPKFRPEIKSQKPKGAKGINKIFRRKSV